MVNYQGKIRDLRQVEKFQLFEKKGEDLVKGETLSTKVDVVNFFVKKTKTEAMAKGKAEKRGKNFTPASFVLVPFQKEKNLDKMLRQTLKKYPEASEFVPPAKEEEKSEEAPSEAAPSEAVPSEEVTSAEADPSA